MLQNIYRSLAVPLGQHRWVWRLRAKALSFRFRLRRLRFGSQWRTGEAHSQARAAASLILGVRGAVALSLLGLIALHAVSRLLVWIGSEAPAFVGRINDLASRLGVPPRDLSEAVSGAYDTFIATTAGVIGLLLGLYFAAHNTVAATVYASVPHDIRSLLHRDHATNAYIKILAATAALAIALLAERAFGFPPEILAVPFMGLLAIASFFSFVQLARHVYRLFDPVLVAGFAFPDLRIWANNATANGTYWRDESFQDHYRRSARSLANAVGALFRVAREREHAEDSSYASLFSWTTAFLGRYAQSRTAIPTTSRWFGQRLRHRRWYLADETHLQLASHTASTLEPETVPDDYWLENSLLDAITDALIANIDAGNLNGATHALVAMTDLWIILAERFDIEPAISHTQSLIGLLTTSNRLSPAKHETESEQDRKLGLAHVAAGLPASLIVGLYRMASSFDPESFRRQVAETEWASPKAPYQLNLPHEAKRTAEWLHSSATFECRAFGKRVTPSWYMNELLLKSIEDQLKRCTDDCLSLTCSEFYRPVFEAFRDRGDACGAASVTSRGLEAIERFRVLATALKPMVEAIRLKDVLGSDLMKSQWDWNSIEARLHASQIYLEHEGAKLLPALATAKDSDAVVDLFGETLHRTAQALMDRLLRNDADGFANLFPPCFNGTFLVLGRLQARSSGYRPEVFVHVLTEPVLELLELSGFALLLSELHQEHRIARGVHLVWDRYLDGDGGDDRLRSIAAAAAGRRAIFGLRPRYSVTTHWAQSVNARLQELDTRESDSPYGLREVDHPSPVVRSVARGNGMALLDGIDIFIELYLQRREGAAGLDFGVLSDGLPDVAPLYASEAPEPDEDGTPEDESG